MLAEIQEERAGILRGLARGVAARQAAAVALQLRWVGVCVCWLLVGDGGGAEGQRA